MATPTVVLPGLLPHESWIHKFGHMIGKVLGLIAHGAAPVADEAAKVAEIFLPQFAGEIQFADNLVSRIAKFALVQEGISAAAGVAGNGPAKLDAVVAQIGTEIDSWVTNNFPGAVKVADLEKKGLVNAVVALVNKIEGK
jgi:hypothetical protein